MKRKLLSLAALLVIGVAIETVLSGAPAWAACDPGTRLDKTTVEDIRQILFKAGYKNIHHLRKGCDSSWHGDASINGTQMDVAVLPDGHVVREDQ